MPDVVPARTIMRFAPRIPGILAALLLFAAPRPAASAERNLLLDPETTTIYFRVDARAHQVLGTLPLASGDLRFDEETGAASGGIVMDPARAETGIRRRDRTMREEVFEVERFPQIVFTPSRVVGTLPLRGSGEVRLEGVLAIHGDEHALSLPVRLSVDGGQVEAISSFEIPYVAWGMKNPGNALLKVADVVEVRVELRGELE